MRPMTDLEEEILFQLISCECKGLLMLSEKVSLNMSGDIPLGVFHGVILKLEKEGLIRSVRIDMRREYSITELGTEALQREWSYYRNQYPA